MLGKLISLNPRLSNGLAKTCHVAKCQYLQNKTLARQICTVVVAAVFLCDAQLILMLSSKTQLPEGCGQDPCDTFTNRCFASLEFQNDVISRLAQTIFWIPSCSASRNRYILACVPVLRSRFVGTILQCNAFRVSSVSQRS